MSIEKDLLAALRRIQNISDDTFLHSDPNGTGEPLFNIDLRISQIEASIERAETQKLELELQNQISEVWSLLNSYDFSNIDGDSSWVRLRSYADEVCVDVELNICPDKYFDKHCSLDQNESQIDTLLLNNESVGGESREVVTESIFKLLNKGWLLAKSNETGEVVNLTKNGLNLYIICYTDGL